MREEDSEELLEKKLFQAYKDVFTSGTEENSSKIQRYQMDTFEKQKCDHHRNQIELFNYKETYYILCKSFNHGNSFNQMVMEIWEYIPGEDNERGENKFVFSVQWPKQSQTRICFDPSMISVKQFKHCLYYFKIINEVTDNHDAKFELYKFDMETQEEYKVKEFTFLWD